MLALAARSLRAVGRRGLATQRPEGTLAPAGAPAAGKEEARATRETKAAATAAAELRYQQLYGPGSDFLDMLSPHVRAQLGPKPSAGDIFRLVNEMQWGVRKK